MVAAPIAQATKCAAGSTLATSTPFRMVANSRYQSGFNPPASFDRADPYDNQEGEVEFDGIGLAGDQFSTVYDTLELKKIIH